MKVEMDLINARVEVPDAKSLVVTAQGIASGDKLLAQFALEHGMLVLNTPEGKAIGWIEAKP